MMFRVVVDTIAWMLVALALCVISQASIFFTVPAVALMGWMGYQTADGPKVFREWRRDSKSGQ